MSLCSPSPLQGAELAAQFEDPAAALKALLGPEMVPLGAGSGPLSAQVGGCWSPCEPLCAAMLLGWCSWGRLELYELMQACSRGSGVRLGGDVWNGTVGSGRQDLMCQLLP